jgi:hypothetical protein
MFQELMSTYKEHQPGLMSNRMYRRRKQAGIKLQPVRVCVNTTKQFRAYTVFSARPVYLLVRSISCTAEHTIEGIVDSFLNFLP